jgi:XTP/dITP diphosphohydrolase
MARRFTYPKLVVATHNRGKAGEIRTMLSPFGVEIVSAGELGLPVPEETGTTFEENALIKAKKVFELLKLPCIADDSGLEVIALNMLPGVRSARYAGEDASYEDNNRKLLKTLEGVPPGQRTAQFRCVTAYVAQGIQHIEEGICPGWIVESPRGKGGFGYDPLFCPEGFDETFAELPPEVKNRYSHRGRAFVKMKQFLASIK